MTDINTYFNKHDFYWMSQALLQANDSAASNEVPVGAVITDGETLLAAAGNYPISTCDPTSHAEINAIRLAATKLKNYRLTGTTLYVTLEPCLMCMGAIIHSRIKRLVFGAFDPKSGAASSCYTIGSDNILNHTITVHGGLLAKESSELLRSFFKTRR